LFSIPYSKSTQFGIQDVFEMISLLADQPGVPCRPSRVVSMFASRACRSAVMIGTALSHEQLRTIVHNMASLENPWCCPHGRPTMRHVWNMRLNRCSASAGNAEE